MSKESTKQVNKRETEAVLLWGSGGVFHLTTGTSHEGLGDYYETVS